MNFQGGFGRLFLASAVVVPVGVVQAWECSKAFIEANLSFNTRSEVDRCSGQDRVHAGGPLPLDVITGTLLGRVCSAMWASFF